MKVWVTGVTACVTYMKEYDPHIPWWSYLSTVVHYSVQLLPPPIRAMKAH